MRLKDSRTIYELGLIGNDKVLVSFFDDYLNLNLFSDAKVHAPYFE